MVSSDSATRWLGPDGRLHDTRTPFGHNVYTMAEHDGGLWLGTKPDGLYRLRGDSLTYMDGIAGNAVYGIIADMEGHIFVGTYDAGLSVITDPESPHPVIKTVRGIPGVRALLRIPQGDIIAGTDNGVYVTGYDGRDATIRKHLLDGSVVMGIAPGPEENEVMVATYGDGLIRLGLTSGKSDTLTTANGLASDICLSLARTPGGGYLMTSEHSVSLFPDDGSPVRIFGPELFGRELRIHGSRSADIARRHCRRRDNTGHTVVQSSHQISDDTSPRLLMSRHPPSSIRQAQA